MLSISTFSFFFSSSHDRGIVTDVLQVVLDLEILVHTKGEMLGGIVLVELEIVRDEHRSSVWISIEHEVF